MGYFIDILFFITIDPDKRMSVALMNTLKRQDSIATRMSNSLTRMILVSGFIHLFSNLLTSIYRTVKVSQKPFTISTFNLLMFSNLILCSTFSFSILIYYKFDRQYRKIFKEIISLSKSDY
jgi:uncharacterized membrane protein